ncbi:MAG: hypothetical protein WBO70_03180 [Erysipelotrichaceae bacterium]
MIKLNKREKILINVLFVLVLVVGSLKFILEPNFAKYQENIPIMEDIKNQITTLEKTKVELDKAKIENESLTKQFGELVKTFSDDSFTEEADKVITKYFSQNGLSIDRLQIGGITEGEQPSGYSNMQKIDIQVEGKTSIGSLQNVIDELRKLSNVSVTLYNADLIHNSTEYSYSVILGVYINK